MTLETKTNRRIEIKTEISELAKREKELREELAPLEAEMISEMQKLGFDSIKTAGHTLSVNTATHPTINDKEKAFKFITEKQMFELLPAQILAGVYREYIENGESIPGVSSYEKTTLSVRKLP